LLCRSAQLQEKQQELSAQEQHLQEQRDQLHKAEATAVRNLNSQVAQLQETLAGRDSKLLLTQQLLQEQQQKAVASRDELKVLQEKFATAESKACELASELSAQERSLVSRKKRLEAAEADVEEQRALLRANLDLLEEREQQLRHKQAAAAAAAVQLSKLRPLEASGQPKDAARAGEACAVPAVAHIAGHARACELLSAAAAPGAAKVVRLTVHIKPSEA
jgi:chromosome segregation ATPase